MISYTALLGNEKVFNLLLQNLTFNKKNVYLYEKDIYGKTAMDYIQLRGWEIE